MARSPSKGPGMRAETAEDEHRFDIRIDRRAAFINLARKT